jgi:hypothetical protein
MTMNRGSGRPPTPIPLPPKRGYSMLNEEWVVSDQFYESPQKAQYLEQTIIYANSFKNGSIEAVITPIESLGTRWDHQPALEANFILEARVPTTMPESVPGARNSLSRRLYPGTHGFISVQPAM